MCNIILQHFDGVLRPLDELSIANIKAYAKIVGAEYRLITGKPFRAHLTSPCQKVYMIDKEFDSYDQVLMLDIDMFAPKGMTENIFDKKGVGLYASTQRMLHRKIVREYPMFSSIEKPYWGGAIYKMDLKLRQKLRSQLGGNESWMNNYNRIYHYEDEGIFHTLMVFASIGSMSYMIVEDFALDDKWCQCSFLPNPQDAGFIHIRTKITPQGPKRKKIENYNELERKGIL